MLSKLAPLSSYVTDSAGNPVLVAPIPGPQGPPGPAGPAGPQGPPGTSPTPSPTPTPTPTPIPPGHRSFNVITDFGAKGDGVTDDTAAILDAISATGGAGQIIIPPSRYRVLKTIVIPRSVTLDCGGDNAAKIIYGGTGAAIAIGDSAGPTLYPRGAMRGLRIVGPGAGKGIGGAPVAGILLGGDPSGIITPATYLGDEYSFYNVTACGFDYALELGVTWLNSFFNCFFGSTDDGQNRIGIYNPATPNHTAGGENSHFFGGAIANNTQNAMQLDDGAPLYFHSTSFDYNNGPIIGASLCLAFEHCHFEQKAGPFIDNSANPYFAYIYISGGRAVLQAASGKQAAWFTIADAPVAGAPGGYFHIDGVRFETGGIMPANLVNFLAKGNGARLYIGDLPQPFGSPWSALYGALAPNVKVTVVD
jgi:hypothetical protein